MSSGSVYRRANSRTTSAWFVRVRLPSGKRLNRRIGPAWDKRGRPAAGFYTKTTAEAELARIMKEADEGGFAPPSGRTFGEAVEAWMRYVEVDRGVRRSTLANYRNVASVHLLPEFGKDTPIEAITKAEIKAYRDRLLAGEQSRRNAQKVMIQLCSIFKLALAEDWIDKDPTAGVAKVKPQKASKDFNVLTVAEVEAVARAASDPTISAVITVAAFSGLRQGELVGLRWRDVDFGSAILHVRRQIGYYGEGTPKSGLVRSVPMIDQVMGTLDGLSRRENFTGPEDSVFATVVGKPVSGEMMREGFYAALLASGLGHKRWLPGGALKSQQMVFHDLRHTFGTIAVGAFALSDVKAFMGHADISTTMVYVHHVPQHDAAAKLTKLVADAMADSPLETEKVT